MFAPTDDNAFPKRNLYLIIPVIIFTSVLMVHNTHLRDEFMQGSTQNRITWVDTGQERIIEELTLHTRESKYTERNFTLYRSPLDRKVLSYDSILTAQVRAKNRIPSTPRPVRKSLNDTIDCKALSIRDNNKEYVRAERIRNMYQYHSKAPQEYMAITKNCSAFIASYGYIIHDWISEDEKNFPLAFSIRMHKSIEQAERLLRAIYRPHNVYCIHIDKKSPAELHMGMAAVASCLPNVFLASRMVNVVYGSFGQMEADLVCMKDLLASEVPWKYYLNLAGTEFPLKTNLEIVTVLKYLNGTNDIEQYPYPAFFHNRFKKIWIEHNGVLIQTNESKPLFHYSGISSSYLKGSSYNSFSRPFIEWIITGDLPQSFINWTKDTSAPDEIIWGTLNSLPDAPGGYPVYVAQTAKTFLSREVIWNYSAARCYGRFVHAICILSLRDLPWLSMRWEFFANKFDIESDNIVYTCLEQELLHRVKNPDPLKSIPWRSIDRAPHVFFTRVLKRNITAAKEQNLF